MNERTTNSPTTDASGGTWQLCGRMGDSLGLFSIMLREHPEKSSCKNWWSLWESQPSKPAQGQGPVKPAASRRPISILGHGLESATPSLRLPESPAGAAGSGGAGRGHGGGPLHQGPSQKGQRLPSTGLLVSPAPALPGYPGDARCSLSRAARVGEVREPSVPRWEVPAHGPAWGHTPAPSMPLSCSWERAWTKPTHNPFLSLGTSQ